MTVPPTEAASAAALVCSFCGKASSRRRKVIERADGLSICGDCVDRVVEALSGESPAAPPPVPSGLVGDHDRERTVQSLREHFAQGRLLLDDFVARCDDALRARTYADLRRATRDLPSGVPILLRAAARGAATAVLTAAWLLFTFLLVVLVGLALLLHEATAATLLGLLLVWLVPTYLLSRRWRRGA